VEAVNPNKTYSIRIKCSSNTAITHTLLRNRHNFWLCKCKGGINSLQLIIRTKTTIPETIKFNSLLIPACLTHRTDKAWIMENNFTLSSFRPTKANSSTINNKLTVLKAAHQTDLKLTLMKTMIVLTLLSKMSLSRTRLTSLDLTNYADKIWNSEVKLSP
jgi:hypothetical protein